MIKIVAVIIAYLLGSIPSGLWIGKLFYKVNLREFGSGNTGTTNAFRALGTTGGIIVFIIDMLKGTIPTLFPVMFNIDIHPLLLGGLAILGHTYSIFDHFKGGKAVATSFGMALGYNPPFALLAITVFFITLWFSRMVSLSSIVAVFAAVLLSFVYKDVILCIIVIILCLFIIYRHRDNINRIKNGTENKVPFGYKYKKAE